MYSLNNAEKIGENVGRFIIRFKYYSPPKKIAILFFIFSIIYLPYYFIFYTLAKRDNLSRGN